MDKILLKQEEIKTLMSGLEGLEQGTPEFKTSLDSVEAAQAELVSLQADAERFAAVQKSLSSFEVPKTVQSGIVQGATIVRDGFTKDPKAGFASMGEMLGSIAKKEVSGLQDGRLDHLTALQTAGTHNTTGDGLMIPAELRPEINVLGKDVSQDWLSRFNIAQTSSNAVELRRDAATTRGGSAGIQILRANELATLTETKNTFEKDTVKVNKIYAYVEVSEEDLSDFPLLQSYTMQDVPEKLRIAKGEDVMFGNGVGRALGFRASGAGDKVQVTRDTANNVKAEDIASMMARAIIGPRSFWIVNQAVWAKLPLMSIANQPVFQNDFTVSSRGALMGMPVFTSEDCEALGTSGDIILVNPDAYFAVEKSGGDNFAESSHVYFDRDAMAFRWTSRFGGIPRYNAPYTPRDKNASTKATLSNVVELT